MDASEVRAIRDSLDLTQVGLGQLLGVHPLTVSKWERGLLQPSAHQVAMLQSFKRGVAQDESLGDQIATLLMTAGVAFAIYKLLEAAFDKR